MKALNIVLGNGQIFVSKVGTITVESMKSADDVRRALSGGLKDVTVLDPRTMLPADQADVVLVNTSLVVSAELVTLSRVERV